MARAQRDLLNLDSLLDTMTNVVGILIVLIAVSQLGLGDAVERIRKAQAADAASVVAELQAREQERARLDAALADARSQWAGLSERSSGVRLAVAEADEELERLQRLPADPALFGLGSEALSAEVERRRAGLASLRGDIEAANAARSRLADAWASEEDTPAELVARVPDPRPAPAGLSPVYVLCRFGRAAPVDIARLMARRREAVDAALGPVQGNRFPLSAEEVPWVANYFEKVEVKDQGLRWVLDLGAPIPFSLAWTSQQRGETAAQLRSGGSAFARWLAERDPGRAFIQFGVWPDAFEAYLEARAQAEARGLHAGWVAFDRDEPLAPDVVSTRLWVD